MPHPPAFHLHLAAKLTIPSAWSGARNCRRSESANTQVADRISLRKTGSPEASQIPSRSWTRRRHRQRGRRFLEARHANGLEFHLSPKSARFLQVRDRSLACRSSTLPQSFVRQVLFTADAVRRFKGLPPVVKPLIKESIRLHLVGQTLPKRPETSFVCGGHRNMLTTS